MRLVYWGLAIGGFVLVVSWLWGALIAFSLILLVIIGYEIWRQSRPLALARRPRKANQENHQVKPESEAPPPANAAAQPAAKPGAKFQLRLVEEKSVRNAGKLMPPSQVEQAQALGGDRTVIQEPLTLISADSDADANVSQADADLADAPTVIESLDQVHFTDAEATPNKANLAEERTVQPRNVNKWAIAKPAHNPSPWDEPVTTPRPDSSNSPTVIRPSAAPGKPTVAKPFQPSTADEPTVASPFQSNSAADEKTVIGPSKAKAGNEPTVARPLKHENNVTDHKPADGDNTNPLTKNHD